MLAAAVAAFRPQVDDPVGGLDHLQIVLDHHHGVAGVDQLVQHFEQLGDVVEMQARRRLVEDVERAPGGAPRQLLGELDALRLAARQRRRLLADMDVAEPHPLPASPACRAPTAPPGRTQPPSSTVMSSTSAIDLSLNVHLQRLAVVALALADFAGDIDVRQEVHLDLDDAVALAGFAAPALDVEREAARPVAARLGLGQPGEPVADRREGAGIGGRVRPRRAADRRLVDVDDLVEVLQALDPVVLARMLARIC